MESLASNEGPLVDDYYNHGMAFEIQITKSKKDECIQKPDPNTILFGQTFSDHMLEIYWDLHHGWDKPKISPFHNFSFHPAAKVFHYAQELFEGMKAFRGFDGKIRLFRPDLNMARLANSAARLHLPSFDTQEFMKCLRKLIEIDSEWVFKPDNNNSLYIRPTFIGIEPTLGVAISNKALLYVILSPVGSYFKTGFKPVSLLADPKYVRAWPGGCGDKKLGANYAPTLAVGKDAEKEDCQQILWLFGEDHQITEIGAMNIFVFLENEKGEKELVTPPLSDGIILPGVVRQSLLDLSRNWNEFKVSERRITMKEITSALKQKRLLEIFGSGTACSVCPVGRIHYQGEDLIMPAMSDTSLALHFLKTLSDIQYGKTPHEWAPIVC